MSSFIIRPAEPADVAEMLAIYSPYVTETTATSEYVPPTQEEFMERYERYTAKFPWLCCEKDGELVGYAYASPHRHRAGYQWSCETSIYTKRGWQRRGIAAALYGALGELLTYQGYYSIYVGITCPNEKSFAFHRAVGFERMGAYENSMYKFGQWHDLIWMGKALRQHRGVPYPTTPFPRVKDDEFTREVLAHYSARIHEAPRR